MHAAQQAGRQRAEGRMAEQYGAQIAKTEANGVD